MSSLTSHYQLQKLDPGEPFSLNGYKYVGPDRDTIDRLAYIGASGHHHDGAAGAATAPSNAPSLSLVTSVGVIPAGTRVAYKYTFVDVAGNETAAGPEAVINTPAPIASPAAPSISTSGASGSLLSGNYYYVLSSYETNTNRETRALNPIFITVSSASATNTNTLTFPSVPSGAAGWNIYRRAPGDSQYFYLHTMAIGPATYADTGGTAPDCNRTLPTINTTRSVNAVNVSLGEALPAGTTWRVYRSYATGDYSNSLLSWVVVPLTYTYQDLGYSTSQGSPPSSTPAFPSPSKILLTGGAEVQGTLPAANIGSIPVGNVEGHPFVVTFAYSGTLSIPVAGISMWICEFPNFRIIGCRAILGHGSTPASANVIVDVNRFIDGATPTYSTIYTTQANRPKVLVGATVGARTVPNIQVINVGEGLTVDLDQVGGGATPTDHDLTINIYGIAYGFPADTDFTTFT